LIIEAIEKLMLFITRDRNPSIHYQRSALLRHCLGHGIIFAANITAERSFVSAFDITIFASFNVSVKDE
jgi:hypothetical protein